VLNKVVGMDILDLFWCYRKKFPSFSIESSVSCEVVLAFTVLKYILLYLMSWEFLWLKKVGFCQMLFEMIIWFLSFILVWWCCYFIDLPMMNHSWIPG
jgi:hypothetical protein